MKIKKLYFLVVLFLCGLSVGDGFAAAPARTWADWARSLFPGAGTATKGHLGQLLIEAAQEGNEPEVERLIAARADVNANRDGWTALMWAALYGYGNIVETLLNAGADKTIKTTQFGQTAEAMARKNDHEDLADMIRDYGGRRTKSAGKR